MRLLLGQSSSTDSTGITGHQHVRPWAGPEGPWVIQLGSSHSGQAQTWKQVTGVQGVAREGLSEEDLQEDRIMTLGGRFQFGMRKLSNNRNYKECSTSGAGMTTS